MKKRPLKIAFVSLLLMGVSALFAESSEPTLVVGELPAYPDHARLAEIKGTVVVEALVDETGNVFAADVVQSAHAELDAIAVAAVSKWKFTPATKDGKAVTKVVRVPIEFNLVDPVKNAILSHDTAIVSKD